MHWAARPCTPNAAWAGARGAPAPVCRAVTGCAGLVDMAPAMVSASPPAAIHARASAGAHASAAAAFGGTATAATGAVEHRAGDGMAGLGEMDALAMLAGGAPAGDTMAPGTLCRSAVGTGATSASVSGAFATLPRPNSPVSVDYAKLEALFALGGSSAPPPSPAIVARQTAAMERLVRVHSREGFPVKELPSVTAVLSAALRAVRAGPERGGGALVRGVAGLANALGAAPFVRRSATDDLRHLPAVAELLTAMGEVFEGLESASVDELHALSPLLRACAGSVANIASGYGTRPPGGDSPTESAEALEASVVADGIAAAGPDARLYCTSQLAVCRSGVAAPLAGGLRAAVCGERARCVADGSLCETLVDALLQLSYHAPSARQAAAAGAVRAVAALINEAPDVSSSVVYMGAELLWNLLDAAPFARVEGRPDAVDAIGASAGLDDSVCAAAVRLASGALLAQPGAGFRRRDKELRNEGFVIMSLLAKGGANSPRGMAVNANEDAADLDARRSATETTASATCATLRESGALRLALLAATAPEVTLRANMLAEGDSFSELYADLSSCCLTRDDDDLELKPLAWSLCTALARRDVACREAVATSLVPRVLVAYLSSDSPPARRCDGSLTPPQLAALAGDAALALCALAPHCTAEVLAAGAPAAAIRATAARGAEPGGGGSGMRLLGALAAIDDAALPLVDAGAVEVSLDIFAGGGSVGSGAGAPVAASDTERRQAAQLVARLCRSLVRAAAADARARFRAAGGVSLLAAELTVLTGMDATLPSARALAAIDLVWAAVASERRSLARLVAGGGLTALLALLEAGAAEHAPLALACLADVLGYAPARELFHSWRSERTGRSAAHMVLALWEAEESVRGMRNDGGTLAEIDKPLAGDATLAVARPPAAIGVYGAAASTGSSSRPGSASRSAAGSPTSAGAVGAFGIGASGAAAIAAAAGSVDLLMRVYAVFVGFDDAELSYLAPSQRATLVGVRAYAALRRGEVWQDIEAELEAEGVRATAPDRARLDTAIVDGHNAASSVAAEQASHLGEAEAAASAREATFYANKMLQQELEAKARVHKRNRMTLTLKERLETKLRRERMLNRSFRSHGAEEAYEESAAQAAEGDLREDDREASDEGDLEASGAEVPTAPSPTVLAETAAGGPLSDAAAEAAGSTQ